MSVAAVSVPSVRQTGVTWLQQVKTPRSMPPNAFWGGAELPWTMKPKRSCRAITLMTVVAFVTTIFVRSGDVSDGPKQDAFSCSGGGDLRALGRRLEWFVQCHRRGLAGPKLANDGRPRKGSGLLKKSAAHRMAQ